MRRSRRVIAEQENNTVADNARMFALINIAMADAGIQCWGTGPGGVLLGVAGSRATAGPNSCCVPSTAH